MLSEGRIPMTEEEETAVLQLLTEGENATVSRRDPGDTGPVVVQTADATYVVTGRKARKV